MKGRKDVVITYFMRCKEKVLFGIMVLWGIRYTVHSIKAKTFGIN